MGQWAAEIRLSRQYSSAVRGFSTFPRDFLRTGSDGAVVFTPFQGVLLCLSAIKATLEPCLRTTKRYRHDESLQYDLLNYLMIQVQSFMDEWRKLGPLRNDVPGLLTVLEVASPAVRRIKKWKGIYNVRSRLLAHSPRDKDGRLTEVEHLLAAGTFPTMYAEQMLVAECAVYAISTMLASYDAERAEAQRMYYSRPLPKIEGHGISTLQEFEDDIRAIRLAILAKAPQLEASFGEFRPL